MPQVPTYDDSKVKAAALPGVRQNINVTSDDFGGAQAKAMTQGGQSLGKAADQITAYAIKKKEEDDQTAVWDAYIKLSDQERDYLYNADKGAYTKTGANANGLTAQTAKDIGGMAQKLDGVLTNENQKKLFKQMYQRKLDGTLDSTAKFEADQRRTHKDQVAVGVVKTSQQNAAAWWNDPAKIEENANIATTAQSGNLRSKGTAEDLIKAEEAALKSGVWKSAIVAAVEKNPLMAEKLLKEHRNRLTGEDAAGLDKLLEVPVRSAKAQAAAGMVNSPGAALPMALSGKITKQASAQGVDPGVAMTIARLENAKGDPSEKNPKSSATGIYQFVDKTWRGEGGTDADRLDEDKQVEIGIKHIKKNTDALRATLGREPTGGEIYLAHQQGLGGAKALLSAPAPMTAVAALQRAGLSPADAQAAVVNNGGTADMAASDFVKKWDIKYAKKSGAGAGQSAMSLSDKITAARALAGDDVEQQKANVEEVTRLHGLQEKAKSADQEAAMENIYGHVLKTGSYAGANPADLAKLDNKTLLELKDKANNAKTDWVFYDKFMSMSAEEKAKVPLQELLTKLSPTDVKAAIKERSDAKNGAGGDGKWLQTRATIVKDFAVEAGIRDSGDKMDAKQQAQYNAYSAYMNRKMTEYREKNNAEMPETEFRQEAARAVTNVVTKKGAIWDDKARVFELNGRSALSIKSVDDLPQTMRGDIEDSLRRGGYVINDALVLSLSKAWISRDNKAAAIILQGAKKL